MAAKWILFVFLSATVSCTCQLSCAWNDFYADECASYYKKFEHSLLNNHTTLWTLQQLLIRENPVKCVVFGVGIVANYKTKCNVTFMNSTVWLYRYVVKWRLPGNPATTNSLSDIMNIQRYVAPLDFTFASSIICLLNAIEPAADSAYYTYELVLYIDELPCSADQSDIADALPPFLTWMKAYAKWRGKPESWDSSDKGVISDSCYDDSTPWPDDNDKGILTGLLMAGYICEFVFVFALVFKFVPSYYLGLSRRAHCNRHIYSFYWGTALVALLTNITLLVLNSFIQFRFVNHSSRDQDIFHVPAKYQVRIEFGVVASIILLSFIVAVLAVRVSGRDNGTGMPVPTEALCMFCCCYCSCICCSRNIKFKIIEIFSLYNILVFVHLLVSSTIPLCFMVILYPGQALSIVASVLSVMFCFIMFAAHLFYIGQASCSQLCLNLIFITSFFSFVLLFIAFYVTCLLAGIHTKGVGGFLASLLPPLFLSAIGWYIKRRFLKPDGNSDAGIEFSNTQNHFDVNDLEQVAIHPSAQTVDVSSSERTPLIQ